MTIKATLEAIHSKRDVYGNCYWALRYTDHESGKVAEGTVSGGESNIRSATLYTGNYGEWDRSVRIEVQQLPIREFNRLTKGWAHAGCSGQELAAFIHSTIGH